MTDGRVFELLTTSVSYPVFKWEGNELLIDNTDTFLNQSGDRKRPMLLFGRKLVETMNWIGQDQYGNYQLSGNLVKEFADDKVPKTCYSDWKTGNGNNDWNPFWIYTSEGLQLSPYANWRFYYLDEAYDKAFGGGGVSVSTPHRSPIYVYSDVGQSTVHWQSSHGPTERDSSRPRLRTQTHLYLTLRSSSTPTWLWTWDGSRRMPTTSMYWVPI